MFVAAGWACVTWLRKPALVQIGAWILVTAIIGGTTVLAYPPAQDRRAGGEHPTTAAVPTKQGPVTGVYSDDRSVEIYAGIPYAQAPVGRLRWAAPQPPRKRTTVFAADHFSDVPIQTTSSFAIRALSKIVTIPLKNTFLNPYPASENSLSLNVWRSSTTPASKKVPVLVYVPGGGFVSGSGALPVYDGAALAKRGEVITVTINYRLGVFGFLSDRSLDSQSPTGTSGNQGILDQVAALQWVHDNIASFGGNPDQVTVAGESAGGESTCILGATPLTKGLINGIIGESGACMGTVGNTAHGDQMDTKKVAESAGERLSKALGGASLAQMRAMPVSKILAAASSLSAHWRPSVDGYVLPTSAPEIYERGEQLHVPTLVGSNEDEASLLLAAPPNTD
ncbi:MAG TPA: carboxylesterase family protein, partial [Pseudolysinimonas sp.]|nr:carboxylesterase family protein [Pseudolysinimonas sp.]